MWERPCCQEEYCDYNPDFAVICSYITKFGGLVDLELDIEQLKTSLEATDQIDESLAELHIKLLKKLPRYFLRDQWQKAAIKFAAEYAHEDADEIERLGYQNCRPSVRLRLLKTLLDAQFEYDQKLKTFLSTAEAEDLRETCTGRDKYGNTYWHFTDPKGALRLYEERPTEDQAWRVVCSDLKELDELIEDAGGYEPEVSKKARTTRQSVANGDISDDSTIPEEDEPCKRCDKSDDPETILLCDKCDDGFHMACCVPPLTLVPEGDWFCPACEQKMLLKKLRHIYQQVTKILEALEAKRRAAERLRKAAEKKRTLKAKKDQVKRDPVKKKSHDPLTYEDVFGDDEDDDDIDDGDDGDDYEAEFDEEDDDTEDDIIDDESETEPDSVDMTDSSVDELIAFARKSKSKKAKKKARRRSPEFSDESEYSDDWQPSRNRRAKQNVISYQEMPDEEDELLAAAARNTKKPEASPTYHPGFYGDDETETEDESEYEPDDDESIPRDSENHIDSIPSHGNEEVTEMSEREEPERLDQ